MCALFGVVKAVPPVDVPEDVLVAQLHALIAVVPDVRVIVTAAVVNHAVMFVRCHVKQLLQVV